MDNIPEIDSLEFPEQGTRFSPVWHCIYCETKDATLGKEHIISLGLGGDLLLPRSSCDACSRITGAIVENHCLRKMFLNLRLRYGITTRNPEDRPTEYPVKVHHSDGTSSDMLVPLPGLPSSAWTVPYFDTLPKALLGEEMGTTTTFRMMMSCTLEDTRQLAKNSGGQSISFGETDTHLFFRMLAKIAHSFAYALLGINGFQPYLQELILTGKGNVGYFIGCEPRQEGDDWLLHRLELCEFTTRKARFLTVRMNLLSFLGIPRYVVVVGESIGDKYRLLETRCYADTIEFTLHK